MNLASFLRFAVIVLISVFLMSWEKGGRDKEETPSLSNNYEILFYDDFEFGYEYWNHINVRGDDEWHISGDDGTDGSKCARFYVTSNPVQTNDDWLVSPLINVPENQNLKVTFKFFYHSEGIIPEFFYASSFDGDLGNSEWVAIDNGFWKNMWSWNEAVILIENPEPTFTFAIRYQSTSSSSNYILIDDFEITSYTPALEHQLVGTSEHFEFYTNISEEQNYYHFIKDGMEEEYMKLSSLWNRPGIDNVFDNSHKIKIYYSDRDEISLLKTMSPNWKNGFHDLDNLEIYIAPFENSDQEDYYESILNLSINEFSQLAISKKFLRENIGNLPMYFLEGFGLYEMGVRPRRDSIIKYVNQNPTPDHNFLRDTIGISNTLKKDMILSNVEGQLLTTWGYLGVNWGASSFVHGQWADYLKYFYTEPEDKRIKLMESSEHFDFYRFESDSDHISEIIQNYENSYAYFIEAYDFIPEHRFRVVSIPSEPIGMALTNYSRFNGGAGIGGDLVLTLSPNYEFDQEFYDIFYAGLVAHEFFHVFYDHFIHEPPGGFWAEGTADFSARHSLGEGIRSDRFWMIEWTFNTYAKNHNVELDLEHISSNPYNELDIYYLGDLFFEFLFQNYGGYLKIKEFFNQGMDYNVFGVSYEEIDKGYIDYLKGFIAEDLDDDNDGVMNNEDQCPYTPVGEEVDANGCSDSQLDDDEDGVMNSVDSCPDTPVGEEIDANGCSESQIDDDEDGIMNSVDVCSDTPVGEEVNENGCSESQLDDDEDGVMNDVDLCPDTLANVEVNEDGCSENQFDDDQDGIINSLDACPNTPEGKTVDSNGCMSFASNNFNIEVISETCPNRNNGELIISVNESADYSMTLNGFIESNFTTATTLKDLEPGDYQACIEVENISAPYCFGFRIEEGTTISGKAAILKSKTSIEMETGTAPFEVLVNGIPQFKTNANNFDVATSHGDLIEVKSAKDCEGVYEKVVQVFDEVTLYPSPTSGIFNVALPYEFEQVEIELFNNMNQMISKKTYSVVHGKTHLDLTNYPTGVYYLKVFVDKPITLKVLKI